jgi:cytochrome c
MLVYRGPIVSRHTLLGAALVLAAAASTAAAPDLKLGQTVYARCTACHSFAYDKVGPRHCGLFGRRAGSVPGFAYSAAMKKSKIVWNAETLDRFLADPAHTVPAMPTAHPSVPAPRERAALIAYLKQANDGSECHDAM